MKKMSNLSSVSTRTWSAVECSNSFLYLTTDSIVLIWRPWLFQAITFTIIWFETKIFCLNILYYYENETNTIFKIFVLFLSVCHVSMQNHTGWKYKWQGLWSCIIWVGVNCSKFDCSTKSRIGRFLSAVRVKET